MTYKQLFYSLLIIIVTFFICVPDLFERGVKGFFGFSSIRVTLNQISLMTFGFLASLRLFHTEKTKPYRFLYLAPILLFGYNLFVNVLDARKTDYNTFTPKVLIILGVTVISVIYFLIESRKEQKNG